VLAQAVRAQAAQRQSRWACLHQTFNAARLSSWPFAIKMAFCPALALAALVAMGLHGIVAANQQSALIDMVVRHDLAVAMHLSESATQLQEINGLLYRLTTLQASKVPGLNVSSEAARLIADTSALADELESQASVLGSERDRAQLLRLVSEVRKYRDVIVVFGSMLELDFASAVEFIRPFDENAMRVLGLLNTVAAHAIQDASSRAEISAHLAASIRLAVAGISAASSLLLFGAAALLTRTTVRSVKQIASATERVARGGADVDVEALARGDELGTIVQSLAVFQANVSQIAFLAHHDSLTQLPNRVLFHDRVQQALAQLDRGTRLAVLCLDLDRFKAVNDTLGHPVGDGLLRQVADRLQACVREGDTVARLGGDEFAIVLLNMGELAEVDALSARIIEVISAGYEVDGHQISIGTSIGVALAPGDASSPNELLRNADTALYGAKANGRGTACFYEAAMNAVLQSRRALEIGLRQAIAREEFQLHYQPLVDARSHRVCGFEALIRWHCPERGMIPPDVFIPVAESSGLIGSIGGWVLRRACLDAATWPDDVKVAVNLSPSQFRDRNLADNVRAALATSGLPARRLELEITESVLLHDSQAVLAILREIKALGVQVAMDDFGTGYSSLSYLRSFPFDKVKIDRSFIKDLPHDTNALAIVRAIMRLSETFGMSVTAEGVETDEQAMQLAREACTQLQGYLFSRPVPVASVPALIERLSAASSADASRRSIPA
jgi:diguanylate cyclase (GGDEF)-like protein